MLGRLLEGVAVEVEVDTTGLDGDGREKAHAILVFVVHAIVEVWHEGVKRRNAGRRTTIRIGLEDDVLAELVVSRPIDDESTIRKIVVHDALGIDGRVADAIIGLGELRRIENRRDDAGDG